MEGPSRDLEMALRGSDARLHALVNQPLVGIATSEHGRFTSTNACFDALFGYDPGELVGCERDQVLADGGPAPGPRGQAHAVFRGRRKDGTYVDVETHTTREDADGRESLVIVALDVTDRMRAEREAQALEDRLGEQAIHDALTGLLNGCYLEDALGRELARARRTREVVSVVFADVDRLADVNARRGTAAGDDVLQTFASVAATSIRAGDLVCRWGGEEFVVLMPGARSDIAVVRADAIRRGFAEAQIVAGDAVLDVTCSFGVASFPRDGSNAAELLTSAQGALRAAKRAGGDRVSTTRRLATQR